MKSKSEPQIPFAIRNTLLLSGIVMLAIAAAGQTPQFTPGRIAVFQEGDGGTNRGFYAASDLNGSRQNPIFISEFDQNGVNQTNPTYRVAIPTNGAGAMLINGNAGTEGNLTLAGNRSVLAFAGYCGDILSIATGQSTAPSNLSYDRGIGTVDAFGSYVNVYRGGAWYGIATGKTNPRGVGTDGAGQFWGCGNGYGSLYYNTHFGFDPIQFQNIALTSCAKVINDTLYATVKGSESVNLYPAGVYSFVDFFNNPAPYPNAASFLHLVIPTTVPYTNCIGFDINPQGTVAYLADVNYGVEKYVRSGLSWALAYNLAIPGYAGLTSGIMTNAGATNLLVGCFSVAVDWSGSNPVVYATTTDSGWNSGNPYYGNRIIRINDTNTVTSGISIIATTNILTTVAKPPGDGTSQLTNIVYKSIAFTPDLRPIITNNPVSWASSVGDNVSFRVGASSPYALGYQWLRGGFPLGGATSATLAVNSVSLTDDTATFQCVVTNNYGAVTSAVAILTVSSSPVPPTLPSAQDITNFVGNNVTITVKASGTDPISYQWFFNGVQLSDANEYSGTATPTLNIANAQTSDGGVYSVVAQNSTGPGSSASGPVANLTIQYAAPVFVQPPQSQTTYVGRDTSFNASGYGVSLSYQWWKGTALSTNTTNTTTTVKTIYTNDVLSTATTNSSSTTTFSGFFNNLTASLQSGPLQNVTNPQLTDASGTKVQTTAVTNPPSFTGVTNGVFVTNTLVTLVTRTATTTSTNSYFVVLSNPGGSLTSAPVTLTVLLPPAHTFVSYTNLGQTYTQSFNSLPIPGGSSAEGLNPLHITYVMTNINGMLTNNHYANPNMASELQYSIDNPVDFGYPILPAGGIGGLGLSNKMDGWYGWAQRALVFAATKGDQSQGAVVDNGGIYYADGTPLTGITNRALGLLATTKTGPVAFGVAFVNNSSSTFNKINLNYIGELWRNNPSQQVLQFGYVIDPAGTNSTFHPDVMSLNFDPTLDVSFPISDNTEIHDGTQTTNQITFAVTGYTIDNWTPGSTLWLTWQGQTLGSAQDVAIDNLSLSVYGPPAIVSQSASSVTASGATLKATVNSDGEATTYYIEYGLTTAYGNFTATNSVAAGSGPGSLSSALTGLSENTTYHFRTVASSSQGTVTGNDVSFVTATVTASRLVSTHFATNGALQFGFTNAAAATFTVLSATNLSLPLGLWQNLGHPTEGPAGQYQFADPQATNDPQRFYYLRHP